MNGFEVLGMETTVDLQRQTRTVEYDLGIDPDEILDECDIPAIDVSRDLNGRLQTHMPAMSSKNEQEAVKDLIEEASGHRPEGELDRWEPVVQGETMAVECSFVSPFEGVGMEPEPIDEALGESLSEQMDVVMNVEDLIDEQSGILFDRIQEARQTAKGVQAAGDGLDFEATCNECGDPLDSDVPLDESLCPDCQEEVCQVDGCEERPDDFYDHMIAEHGFYNPTLDPTEDQE